MKKFLMILALFSAFTITAFAQEADNKKDSKWSEFSYVNVPILKVYEGKDAYVVLYQKYYVGIGKTVIPKKWAKGTPENPRKLKFRNTKVAEGAYMSVIKKGGEFHRVILTVPMNKQNEIWGVADYHKQIEGSDKDTLEELDLY